MYLSPQKVAFLCQKPGLGTQEERGKVWEERAPYLRIGLVFSNRLTELSFPFLLTPAPACPSLSLDSTSVLVRRALRHQAGPPPLKSFPLWSLFLCPGQLTHGVMNKELKYCKNPEDLECNENVKHKTKEYIKKYMQKFGAVYKPKEDTELE